eukprot:m.38835 g.38835  ORF g.38835 m.38835 type:complete len:351 (-) comp18024_c1_seq1:260-1312(-)
MFARCVKPLQLGRCFGETSSRICTPLSLACHRRGIHTAVPMNSILSPTRLDHRRILSVSGKTASTFLQGLVTNDINKLDSGELNSMYTFFLNAQGRVMFDVFMYKVNPDGESNEYLLDCDDSAVAPLTKHLKKYKLRQKITIADLSETYASYAAVEPTDAEDCTSNLRYVAGGVDPRFPNGIQDVGQLVRAVVETSSIVADETLSSEYTKFRVANGLGEGSVDFPNGNCLPLESNLDILNGVSFTKGCYLGQELTARTHHTGVTRKRLVPVVLKGVDDDAVVLGEDRTIRTNAGRSGGQLRTVINSQALAMFRLANLTKEATVNGGDDGSSVVRVSPSIPTWWPAGLIAE